MIKVNIRMFLFASVGMCLMMSCELIDGDRDQRIAKAYNKYLYKSDIEGLVAPGLSAADSVIIVKRYIDNWIRQQIYLHNAERNLSSEDLDINRKIEDYRNSLVVFTHENKLLNSHLDTLVSEEILAEYYEKHQREFTLKDNIVKLNYIKVPINVPGLQMVRKLIVSDREDDLIELEEYALNNAASYFLDQDSWFVFSDILRDLPINPQNHQSFLRNNKFVEFKDQFYFYFIYLRDFKLEGSPSPLALQSEIIRSIILNHRRQAFINEYRQNIYMEAARNENFVIY
jgi:hypothetical protein